MKPTAKPDQRGAAAFTLLEVMIALGIFFTATFAILSLMSGTLRNARALQQSEPDLGQIAAKIAMTNSLSDATMSGNFGDAYKGYAWSYETYAVGSNNLWEADIVISRHAGRGSMESRASVLFYRPQSPVTPVRGNLQ